MVENQPWNLRSDKKMLCYKIHPLLKSKSKWYVYMKVCIKKEEGRRIKKKEESKREKEVIENYWLLNLK